MCSHKYSLFLVTENYLRFMKEIISLYDFVYFRYKWYIGGLCTSDSSPVFLVRSSIVKRSVALKCQLQVSGFASDNVFLRIYCCPL